MKTEVINLPFKSTYPIIFLFFLNCVYYTQQDLDYMDGMLAIATKEYSDAKLKEMIPRARTKKFLMDGDTAAYFEALDELKKIEIETFTKQNTYENVKTKRDHIAENCCR